METILKTWEDFKLLIDNNIIFVENKHGEDYNLFCEDGGLIYKCTIYQEDTTDKTDYETNYQSKKSTLLYPVDIDGKPYSRAESRPLNKTTYFTMIGDDSTTLRAGKSTIYDFADTNDDITPPAGFKKKRLDLTFLNAINIKEGAIYFQNMEWGSYIDLSVVAPAPIVHPTLDITVEHFVANHFIFGTNNLGDELNTEAASSEIPAGFIFRLEVTVPDTVWTAGEEPKGFVSFEMYTKSTTQVV